MIRKIKEKIRNILEKLIDKNILKTFSNIKNLEIKYKILWLLMLKITTIFVILNIVVIIISIFFYILLYIKKRIQIKIFNKKVKNLVYKKRFKFLKNFYIICAEKIFITFPKQKAFLFVYITTKAIYEKDKTIIKKEYIPEFIKSISNRILIIIILSIPYIIIYCNTNLILIVKDLNSFQYESKKAYINSLILNIFKDLENEYNKLILKLKIKFFKNKIIFNSKKDLLKALIYKKNFINDFKNNKKYFRFLIVKQKTSENSWSKEHFTALNKIKNGKILYLNETSKENFNYYKYNKDLNKYIIEKHKNMYMHLGTINKKKMTYYTPNIITKENNILVSGSNNANIIKNLKEENINKIMIAHSLNLDENYWETIFKKIENIEKNIIVENNLIKKTIDFYKENKDDIETEQFECIMGMQFFWNENNKYIENLNLNEKMELCNDLKMEISSSIKEINFNLFKEVMSKK